MTRLLMFGLIACLFASPVRAESLKEAISRAAAQAAIQQTQAAPQPSRRINRGLLWTGIGLLGAGGLYFGIGAAAGDDEACVSVSSREDCVSIRKVALIAGTVLAGTGGALLGIGIAKSRRSPSISFVPAGVVVRQQVPLKFSRHRR